MRLFKIFGLLLILIICITACAPRPVFRLESMAGKSTWYQGTEYISSSRDSVTVTVAYFRHVGDYVIFDVEVANSSDNVVRVDPVEFQFKAYKSIKPVPEFADLGYAVNPEKKLLDIDKKIAEEDADQRTAFLLGAIGATTVVAGELAEDDDTAEENAQQSAAFNAVAAGTANEMYESEFEINSLQSRREAWAIESLRKTDLFPDEFIRGKVYFPLVDDARYFNIEIKTGNIVHIFKFRQLKFKP